MTNHDKQDGWIVLAADYDFILYLNDNNYDDDVRDRETPLFQIW